MKERELRRLRPEIRQEVLPLAKRLTGQTPILKRMDTLPHDTNGLLIRPERPNQPWEILYRRGHERLLEHVIAHEVGHIVRLYQVPESERLGLMVTERTRERALEATAPELARLLEHGFPEQELPGLFEEWLGALGSQLYAFPADLRIEAWMSKTYPGLRAIQQRSLLEEVGRNGPLFESAVRALVPQQFYYPMMAMNAAQAWQVAMLYNRPDVLTQFQQYNLAIPGRNLARIVLDAPDEGHRSDMAATEQWAEELGITGWFEWMGYPSGVSETFQKASNNLPPMIQPS